MLVQKCSAGHATVTIQPNHAQVVVPPECEGEPVSLYLASESGTTKVLVGTGSGQVSLPSSASSPEEVLVTAGTWPLRTDWSGDVPEAGPDWAQCQLPSGTCEVTQGQTSAWADGEGEPTNYIYSVWISSSSPTPEKWVVTINLSSSELPFLADWVYDGTGLLVKVKDSGCSAVPRTLTVEGRTDWGNSNSVGQGLEKRQIQTLGRRAPNGSNPLMSCPTR